MTEKSNLRTGGQILVDQLRIHGTDTIYCVPGESYLASLDALYDASDDIRLVVCRQEGGAAYMADAYGKLTGRPGVCFVPRGPGAANASLGIHTAHQDSTPVVLLIGQAAREMLDREAFQEADFRRMYGPLTKWVAQIGDAARIPEMVSRAFQVATSGRPGPVALALPEDMQREATDAADAATYCAVQASPGPADMERLGEILAGTERPFVIVGGSGWTAAACADLKAFVEAHDLPVGTAFRRQDLVDNRSANYAGDVGLGIDPGLAKRIEDADLLLVIGAQLGEIVTDGYRRLTVPRPRQTLIHVCAGTEELGKVYQPDLAINSGMVQFAATSRTLRPAGPARWAEWTRAARADYEANIAPAPRETAVDFGTIMVWLRETLPDDAIIANGAGNCAAWVHRFYVYRRYGTQLAPQSGSMGYGVPAAVAAKLRYPGRIVVGVTGDGDFLMNGQELATAVQYGANAIFIVVNNESFGTIRMHQERLHPGRVIGTDLVNPDFAALARAYGANGEVVATTAEFAPAFERALKADRPTLLELRVDKDAISHRVTLSELRAEAEKKAGK